MHPSMTRKKNKEIIAKLGLALDAIGEAVERMSRKQCDHACACTGACRTEAEMALFLAMGNIHKAINEMESE